jgi:hypothetical protein
MHRSSYPDRERIENRVLGSRRKHRVNLEEIARGIGEVLGIRLGKLKGKVKDSGVMEGGRLFHLVGREYGYKGKEIEEFLGRDPAAVTGSLTPLTM